MSKSNKRKLIEVLILKQDKNNNIIKTEDVTEGFNLPNLLPKKIKKY